jgi:hypothetical protein
MKILLLFIPISITLPIFPKEFDSIEKITKTVASNNKKDFSKLIGINIPAVGISALGNKQKFMQNEQQLSRLHSDKRMTKVGPKRSFQRHKPAIDSPVSSHSSFNGESSKQMRLHQKPRRSTRLSEEQENQKSVQNVKTVVKGLVQKPSPMRCCKQLAITLLDLIRIGDSRLIGRNCPITQE